VANRTGHFDAARGGGSAEKPTLLTAVLASARLLNRMRIALCV
jgi:hypothetical protein